MVKATIKAKHERWESDLLLNVVLAHMAFASASDEQVRNIAHDRFVSAIRKLYEFVAPEVQRDSRTGA